MPKVLSLDKSLTVLEAIFQHRDGIGTRALAAQLKLNVASVHNIAQTFCKRGYLRQDPDSKVFYPGIRLLLLGRHPSYIRSLSLSASAIVDDVARKLNESVMLASMDHGRVLNLKYVPSRQALRVQESEDMSQHAYCTAVGKILLTSMTETEFSIYLHEVHFQSFTPHTITTAERLRQEVQTVREKGYAQTRDEFCEGISAVAVPIYDPWGTIVAGIGASAPTVRMDHEDFAITLDELRRAATQIEEQWKASHQERTPRKVSRPRKAVLETPEDSSATERTTLAPSTASNEGSVSPEQT